MKFNKITLIDDCGLTQPVMEKLGLVAGNNIVMYNDVAESDKEIINRIGDSDCVLVSWKTKVNAAVIRNSPNLKYIGMCCSLYNEDAANVDIREARKQGVVVKGVRDYGDEGTVEFIFAQLIYLFKGLGKYQWRNEKSELKNKSMGIIGLGTLGLMVANTAAHFGMQVYYYSRTRKPEAESSSLNYLPLADLLKTCDVVSIHLPKNTVLLGEAEFRMKKKNSVLVNTSLGLAFDKNAFLRWLQNDETSFAILDGDGIGDCENEFRQIERIIYSPQFSGFTVEAKQRLSEKVLLNIEDFFANR